MGQFDQMSQLDADDPRQVGPYVLVKRLGHGGMGRVYLGRSVGGRLVAVKVIRPDLADDAEFRARFGHEVAAAQRVNGFYTAAVVDADADPSAGPPWLATAYVPGPSLAKAIDTCGPLPATSHRLLAAGLAEALRAIHRSGMVHRDLKPANVLLALDGPRVIDFGIARAVDRTRLTRDGIIGTAAFMAPEQALNREVTFACDVFTFGVVLAYTATARLPFGDGQPHAVVYRIVHAEPDLEGIAEPLRGLIASCLAKDMTKRPTAEDILATIGFGLNDTVRATTAGWLPPDFATLVTEYEGVTEYEAAPPSAAVHPGQDRTEQTPLPPARRWRGLPLVAGVCSGLLVLVAAVFVIPRVVGPADAPCGVSLTIAASPEKFAELKELAERFNDSGCWSVTVLSVSSGDALDYLTTGWDATAYPQSPQPPQVWSPAATGWVRILQQRAAADDVRVVNDDDGVLPSVTKTPLVLAMPQPVAERLGWPTKPIGWQTVLELAADPAKWRSVSGGQWGGFKLGKTNPNYSTSGLNSLIAAYATASGSQTVTAADVSDQSVRRKISAIESAAVHYGETTLTYLCNLAAADSAGADQVLDYVHAVPVEEKSVYEYNQGQQTYCPSYQHVPEVKLVAVYPGDGTVMSDSPYAILGNATVDQRRLAEQFLDFLHEPEQQKTLKAAGFRGADDGELDAQIARDPWLAANPTFNEIEIPDPEVLEAIRTSWAELRKPARVLFVVDVSGSMAWSPYSEESPQQLGEMTRMGQVKAAAIQALAGFSDRDEVGLWEFSDYGSGPLHREVVAPVPISLGRDLLESKINDLEPEGDTPLYITIRDAQRELAATAQADQITAIVVLTDGHNTYDRYPKEDLINDIEAAGDDQAVRIFTVAYAHNAPREQLAQIAVTGRGKGYDSTNPDNVDKVLREVVSNF